MQRPPRRNSADGIRLRPFRHRSRVRRRTCRPQGGGDRRAGRHRGIFAGGGYLRDPRLRAQEAARLRLAISGGLRGQRVLRLDARLRRIRLADAHRQQGQGDRPARGRLPRKSRQSRRGTRREPRHAARRASDRARARRAHRLRGAHPDRHRRTAQPACRARRARALHHLQRGVLPGKAAAEDRHRRRRIHRRRVRRHFFRPRRRHDDRLSRPRAALPLRHGPAPPVPCRGREPGHPCRLP